eukprot:167098_1
MCHNNQFIFKLITMHIDDCVVILFTLCSLIVFILMSLILSTQSLGFVLILSVCGLINLTSHRQQCGTDQLSSGATIRSYFAFIVINTSTKYTTHDEQISVTSIKL